jgi:hypothetical protein
MIVPTSPMIDLSAFGALANRNFVGICQNRFPFDFRLSMVFSIHIRLYPLNLHCNDVVRSLNQLIDQFRNHVFDMRAHLRETYCTCIMCLYPFVSLNFVFENRRTYPELTGIFLRCCQVWLRKPSE